MMRRCFRVWTILLLALTASWSHAERVVPLSVEELGQGAEVVLHGVVLSRTTLRDAAGRIYTRVEVEVTEVWKGPARVAGRPFTVVHGGGVLGEERGVVFGQARYEVGEEVVLFLRLNPRGEGVTLGLAQGKFQVSKSPTDGEKVVSNPFHGVGGTAGRSVPSRSGAAPRLTLGELKRRVQGGPR